LAAGSRALAAGAFAAAAFAVGAFAAASATRSARLAALLAAFRALRSAATRRASAGRAFATATAAVRPSGMEASFVTFAAATLTAAARFSSSTFTRLPLQGLLQILDLLPVDASHHVTLAYRQLRIYVRWLRPCLQRSPYAKFRGRWHARSYGRERCKLAGMVIARLLHGPLRKISETSKYNLIRI
jgi:hypothetical protein